MRQVHGSHVAVVGGPDDAGATADAAVTAVPGLALAVYTADCAPVVLVTPGAVGVAHAGWRGLVDGVLQNAVAALRTLGGGPVAAHVGPHIRSRCYEFGSDDLAVVADRLGPRVRASTAWGTDALDLTAGVVAALAEVGVDEVHDSGVCTACSPFHFSHRARVDRGRLASVTWIDPS